MPIDQGRAPRTQEQKRQQGNRASRGERSKRGQRGAVRGAEVPGIEPEFLARQRLEGAGRVGNQRVGLTPCLRGFHAARDEDQRQFAGFLLGILGKFRLLERDLVLIHLLLRAHRHIFAGGHGERARKKAGDAGQQHDAVGAAGPRDAEYQARVRDQSVVDAEYGGAQAASGSARCVALAEFVVARGEFSPAAIQRHATHLHRRERMREARRAEPVDQSADEARTGIQRERARRTALRLQAQGPVSGLRFGFARQFLEQAPAARFGFARDDAAVQMRGGKFAAPGFERVHAAIIARGV